MSHASANVLYQRIRKAPKLAALTQTEIARRAGITQSQVSRIMNGSFTRVTAKSVLRLCEFARISVNADMPLTPNLQNTLRAIWDGSKTQERALVHLLKAAAGLALAREKRGDVEGRRR
jgi:transcriptional regulator with XRE-family HTH domain